MVQRDYASIHQRARYQINVRTIAEIITEEMGLKDVEFKFTGGVDDGRGWTGDVKNMLLDISKIRALAWKPKLNSEQAVKKVTDDMVTEFLSNRKF